MSGCQCREVVVYTLKPDRLADWPQLRRQMDREMAALPGFISIESLASTDQPHQYLDWVTWQDQASAKRGFELWRDLPSCAAFMACVAEVKFTGHFSNPT